VTIAPSERGAGGGEDEKEAYDCEATNTGWLAGGLADGRCQNGGRVAEVEMEGARGQNAVISTETLTSS
jgi:hypothetical protein